MKNAIIIPVRIDSKRLPNKALKNICGKSLIQRVVDQCVKTNINRAIKVINPTTESRIKKVVALSTDKACNPINLYGASKLASDKLFVAGNSNENTHKTIFSVVRYGNVMGSRGSVIPYFLDMAKTGILPITDMRMTRFMISLEEGINLVWEAFKDMKLSLIHI